MRGTDGALHPRTVRRAGRRAQGDRAAQPPRLVELPGLPRPAGTRGSCPKCDVTLVLHRARALLACHHCGHRERVPERVHASAARCRVARHGTGTERLEHDLLGARPRRAAPRRRRRATPAAVLRAFERAERGGARRHADGRQGPRLPRRRRSAWCVDADATLRFPDFRAEERTFALVAQLAGPRGPRRATAARARADAGAGRRVDPLAARHDADGFLAGELAPPRGAALPAVLDAHPGRLLRRRQPGARARGGDARSAGAPSAPPCWAPRRCSACAAASARRSSSRRPTAAPRSAAVGAAVDAVARAQGRRALSVDVDPQ